MKCPVCNEEMLTLELDGVEIDYCYSCGGIWLDEGELELLLENTELKDKLLASFTLAKRSREKRRRCPICRKKMEKVFLGDEKNILLDRCPKRHGIWFDKGELAEVVQLVSFDENNTILDFLKNLFLNK